MADPRISAATAEFLAEVMPVIVGTRRRAGAVKLTPAWYEYRDGLFWLNSWRGAHWLAQLERQGGATLLLLDPADMYRSAHIEARLLGAEPDDTGVHIDRLSQRYRGEPYRSVRPQRRVSLRLEPLAVRSSLDVPGRGARRPPPPAQV